MMKRKLLKRKLLKRKLLSVLICVGVLTYMLAGCNGGISQSSFDRSSKKGSAHKYEKFITVDVFNSQGNYHGILSGWFADVVKEKFNMEFNIIAPNVAGGGELLFQTRSAAGTVGDIVITSASNGRLDDLVRAGLLLDMTPYLEGREHINQYQTAIDNLMQVVEADGVWGIPSEISKLPPTEPSEGLDLTFGPYLRWDIYAEIGYPQMETLEDLLPVLKEMQDTYPLSDSGKKVYAFSFFQDWDENIMIYAKQLACFYGYDAIGFVLAKADGSDYQSIIDDDSLYIRALKLFFDANQMGLVDPESATQNYDILYSKYRDGAVLFSPWPWLGKNAYNTTENREAGKGFMFAPIDDVQIFSYGCNPNGNPANFIGIGSNAEDPERLMDFIDWLYSPEGIMMSATATAGKAGPEGLTWEMVDGSPELTEFGEDALLNGDADMPEDWGGGSWKDGTTKLNYKAVSAMDLHPEYEIPYSYSLWESVLEMNETPLDLDWQEHMGATTTIEYLAKNDQYIVAPGSGYAAPQESSEIQTLRGQCSSVIVEYSWKMIFAKDEVEFYQLLSTMQEIVVGLGYDKVLEVDMKNAIEQNEAREEIVRLYQ